MARKRTLPPGLLTATYATVATLWIVFSDLAVAWIEGATYQMAYWQMGKGLIFVAITSLMLHALTTMLVRQARDAERSLSSELERMNRLYATLARANEAALSATERARLCDDICRALVECAGMRLAWIGWVDPASKLVVVEASAGAAVAYVQGLVISSDPSRPESRGPTGRSIEERCTKICADIARDDVMAPWRERALMHGLHSSAAVFVRDADGTPGSITIYSGEKNFFSPEVVKLVEQLAKDLAHGLQVLATRRQIAEQSQALRASEQRWQFALEGADEGVWDWEMQTGRVYFSARLQTMLGYEPGEFTPHVSEWEKRIHPEDLERTNRELADYLEGRAPTYFSEHRLRCKDGSYRWIRDRGKVMERDPEGKPLRMIGTHSDVTDQRAAHQLIANALAFSEAVFNTSPIGIITYAGDGRTLSVNAAAARIVGSSIEELRGQNFREIRSWRAAGLLAAAEDTLAEGRANHRQAQLVTSFGRNLSLEVDFVPFFFGGERQLLLMFQDVTERQRAEAALKVSEQRWQFALEGAGDGVWDWNIESGNVVFSPQLVRMFGYEPGDFSGRFEEWLSHVHPEDLPLARAQMDECLAGRVAILRSTHRLLCKDGSHRWVLSRGKVVERDVHGKPLRLIGTFTDITEIRRYEQRLLLLDTALQAMPAGIVITDREGRIEWVNRGFTQLTGYAIGEALGGNPRLLKSGRHPPEFYQNLWQTILRGEVWAGELVNRRKDGTEYNEHMIIAPVSHAQDGITHFIAIKQDITERKEMESRLLRSQRMEGIGLLAGGIAHDLNNVLAPILLSVELLRMRLTDLADRRTIELIESSARRGSGVVRQVLTFARGIDGERAQLRPRDLVRELVLIIEETFPRDITILRDVAEDTPMVLGDTTQLHQVLLNLAVNARDAMPQGGTLTFHIRPVQVEAGLNAYSGDIKPGLYVLLAVQDTGQGMSPEIRDRIFEPFFTTKPRGKGTGLGLPTVLGIVRSHGGFIDVVSEPGRGSEFRIYLPAVPAEVLEEAPAAAPRRIDGAGRTVLICDDEPTIREVARVVLGQSGFKVLEAGNGREGLQMFTEHAQGVSLVLMDIMMPLMTGDRAATEMLRLRPDLPVIFMSGLMEQDTIEAALKNVALPQVTLLKKPFTATELLELVGRRLDPA
jgi:PAS domain S-box-containing protein